MSSKLIAIASTFVTPTITIAYIDKYWHKGYTEKYLSIGKNIVTPYQVKNGTN